MTDINNNSVWSETDGSNNGLTMFAEGMNPSAVNDNMRGVVGALKRFYNHINATVTSAGTANSQTLTYAVAPSSLVAGDTFAFIVGALLTNTSSTALNVNALGAKTIKLNGANLGGGELLGGSVAVVMYDGTNFQLIARSGGTLPGGLTAGSVIFASGASSFAQDNANLFWDDTNNRLGIGTNGPGSILHVNGQGTILGLAAGDRSAPTVTNTNLLLYKNSTTNWSGIGSSINGDMYFVTGTSAPVTRLYIDTAGNSAFSGSVSAVALSAPTITGTTVTATNLSGSTLLLGGRTFANASGVYNVLYDGAGNGDVFLGSGGDPTNYYRNTVHQIGSIGGAASYATIGSGLSTFNGNLTTTGTLSAVNVSASGNITASSTVTAGTVNATNMNTVSTMTAANLTASSTVTAGTVNSTNMNVSSTVTAANLTASSTVTAGTVNSTNMNASGTVTAGTVNSTNMNAVSTVTAANLTASSTVTAGTVNATNMNASSTMSAVNMSASGNITASSTVTAGTVNATNMNAVSTVTAANLTASSTVTAGTVNAVNMNASGNTTVSGTVSAGALIATGSANVHDLTITGSGTSVFASGGSIQAAGDMTAVGSMFAVSFVPTSDRNLKENIIPLAGSQMAGVRALKPMSFNFKTNKDRVETGFIAQDLQGTPFANLVVTVPPMKEGDASHLGINYNGLIAPLVAAMKELDAIVTAQAATIALQATAITALTARVRALETRVTPPGP